MVKCRSMVTVVYCFLNYNHFGQFLVHSSEFLRFCDDVICVELKQSSTRQQPKSERLKIKQETAKEPKNQELHELTGRCSISVVVRVMRTHKGESRFPRQSVGMLGNVPQRSSRLSSVLFTAPGRLFQRGALQRIRHVFRYFTKMFIICYE